MNDDFYYGDEKFDQELFNYLSALDQNHLAFEKKSVETVKTNFEVHRLEKQKAKTRAFFEVRLRILIQGPRKKDM
jgi:threonyl-tRNA synthetase